MVFTDFEQEREDALELIAARVDAVANAVCERHYDAPTQEHQMSAKLAEAIEKDIGGLKTRPFTVGVAVQDFPDKGRDSWERPTGADLYMSIVRIEDEVTSKGMLVQSKWDRTFSHNRTDVRQQCERMLARSESSYVWVFGPHQVVSIHAEDVLSRRGVHGQTVGQQIANGLRCSQGDLRIGRDTSKPLTRGLRDVMRELAREEVFVEKGVGITLRSRPARRRR